LLIDLSCKFTRHYFHCQTIKDALVLRGVEATSGSGRDFWHNPFMGNAAGKLMIGGATIPDAMGQGVIGGLLLFLMQPAGAQPDREPQCQPAVEARADQGWLRVRPHVDAFLQCTLGPVELAQLVREFLLRPEHGADRYQSLFLGRLVEYPWLSRYLAGHALEDNSWDGVHGLPGAGGINEFVRRILSTPDALALLQPAFDGTGYTVTGVSVEKVLVVPANSISWLEIPGTVLVPYDALTHVQLKKE
jgi:hypothetical protein